VPQSLALAAMATRFELVLDDEARAAGESALEAIADVERRLSRFRRDSVVARLAEPRRHGPARSVVLTRDEVALVELCRRACARSDGAFDPALGEPPFASWRVDRKARRLFAPRDGTRLDFGGVGKGYALDLAARELCAAGVARALIHGGTSSVTALGSPPGAAAWKVALRDPVEPERAIATVLLRDAALSVSAPHGRVRIVEGRARGHVVDPRDGTPVERARLAAVVARHGAVAEVWSTALLVLAERRLRRGAALDARALRLPPSISALVAFERGGSLQVELFGRRAALFSVVPRALALVESSR